MRGTKSAGVASRLATSVLLVGIALLLVGGGLAADLLLSRPSAASTTALSAATNSRSSATSSSSVTSSSIGTATSTTTASTTYQSTASSSASSSSTPTTSISTTSTSQTSTRSTSTGTSTTSSSTSSSVTQAGTVQIFLPLDVGNNESLNFQPSKLKVVIGVNNTIVWNDLDYVQHTVKSVSVPTGAKTWDSGILNQGQTFTQVLTVPGNYKYVCTIHPDWMIGTIQVVQ